jgi:ubiquinone/menaquinone biosynthesis C-methylase UbiE
MTLRLCWSVAAVTVLAGAALPASAQDRANEYDELLSRIEAFEKRANARQPAHTVLDAVGVESGMVVGELGAGRGRYTVHLARRVGDTGKVYANDIDAEALAFLRERCRREKMTNVETVLGEVEDPRFPEASLDMIFMVWVYHMVDSPVALLRSFGASLKPGAPVVMVEPPPAEIQEEIDHVNASGEHSHNITVLTEQRVAELADEAGFVLVRTVDDLLDLDIIYILRQRSES